MKAAVAYALAILALALIASALAWRGSKRKAKAAESTDEQNDAPPGG